MLLDSLNKKFTRKNSKSNFPNKHSYPNIHHLNKLHNLASSQQTLVYTGNCEFVNTFVTTYYTC